MSGREALRGLITIVVLLPIMVGSAFLITALAGSVSPWIGWPIWIAGAIAMVAFAVVFVGVFAVDWEREDGR